MSERVREDACAVYRAIAEAEGEAHGAAPDMVHFHEVGSLDAIADVVGVSLLMEQIAPERVVASPVRVGYGTVKCAHGLLSVPAPATAALLKGVPIYAGALEGEMCTPTGAALLKHFATEFGHMPEMETEAVGVGLGTRDFGTPNCLRAFLGESRGGLPRVSELRCNIDDATPEELGFAMDVGQKNSKTGLSASFGNTKGGQWIRENCYRFGFILRYQEGWEEITGYNYEPWHVRYVGEEWSMKIKEANVPFETYLLDLREEILLRIVSKD